MLPKIKSGTCWLLTEEGNPGGRAVRFYAKPRVYLAWDGHMTATVEYKEKYIRYIQLGLNSREVLTSFGFNSCTNFTSISKAQFNMLWNLAVD